MVLTTTETEKQHKDSTEEGRVWGGEGLQLHIK